MTEPRIITAIDVGTTKVFALVAAADQSGTRLLAHATVPCEGLSRGNVEDVDKTGAAIRSAIDMVEAEAGIHVDSAYVGVTGAHVSCENRRDRLDGVGSIGVITPEDLAEATPASQATNGNSDRRLVHAMPISYTLDGEEGIRNPVGMHSRSVEVDTHVITADRGYLDLLVQATAAAGIGVTALVMEPLASGLAALTAQERERGTVLIDVGGGTTDMVAFRGDKVCHTAVVPVGGFQFTNDICITFNVDYESAERAKLEHGHTEPAALDPGQAVEMMLLDRPVSVSVSTRELSQLLRERAVELANLVRFKLEEADPGVIGSARVVLTGGASKLPGMADIFQRQLGRRVRLGGPVDTSIAMAHLITDPAHATGLGILKWAVSQPAGAGQGALSVRQSNNRWRGNTIGRLTVLGRRLRRIRLAPQMPGIRQMPGVRGMAGIRAMAAAMNGKQN